MFAGLSVIDRRSLNRFDLLFGYKAAAVVRDWNASALGAPAEKH
jgi:hypothetical protein